ncbi:MAG TPA: DUF3299 domain-containing protein [Burkholderiaceae bacterium]
MKRVALILMLACATAAGLVLGQVAAPGVQRAKAAVAAPASGAATGAATPAPPAATTPTPNRYREVSWDDLTPKDWDPLKQFREMNLGQLSDADPKAVALLQRMRETWDNAPTNVDLDGQDVRIAGYLVPLDETKEGLVQFLLVPYFGACIHTPPPPSNQIIEVRPKQPSKGYRPMDTVWVSGTLRTLRSETYMGASSYRMEAMRVEPYVRNSVDR